MKVRIAYGLGAAVLTAALAAPAAALDGRPPPTNKFGLPVIGVTGQGINYGQSELGSPALVAGGAAPAVAAPNVVAITAGAPSARVHKTWSYALFGAGIGATGIVTANMGRGTEVIVAGTAANMFGPNDHWLSLQYSPASGAYEQTHAGDYSADAIVAIAATDLNADGADELLVLHKSGALEEFAGAAKRRVRTVATGVASPTQMRVADVDGDGAPELLVINSSDLFILAPDGTLKTHEIGAGGTDVVAGNMDDDPGMEIATTKGVVYDAATATIQWNRSGGFGEHLALVDGDGDGRAELIAADAWYYVWAYDVERQLPKWSIRMQLDIDAVAVADVNGDGAQELLVGDGQWGKVWIYNPATGSALGSQNNPQHGVTNIAVADVDGDGRPELLWGAGYSSTGEDHLYVARPDSGSIIWQSLDLVGPFIGPEFADVNGDGVEELIVASSGSNAGHESGRLLVFSLTGKLLAMSGPLFENYHAWTGLHDVKVRVINGVAQILVASDWLYDGAIESYTFQNRRFTRQWTNATRPVGAPFWSVDARDVDGDGAVEIIGGGGREHTGAAGVFLYVYDGVTGAEKWHSMQCGTQWDKIISLAAVDPDADGNLEMAALVASGDLYFFEGNTKQLDAIMDGGYRSIFANGGGQLLFGAGAGKVGTVEVRNGAWGRAGVVQYGARAVQGMLPLEPGRMVVTENNRLKYWIDGTLAWQSRSGGAGYGRSIVQTPTGFATAGLSAVDHYRRD